ncbi:CAAX geranylgeranyltransferase alpha subunit [Lambiella insularis]|nr:CAAX geranylgeranyltransferase alpha subunit [Lambiella insularis]
MGKYEKSRDWNDIVPIPQDDGGPNPLAAIAYTAEYSEAMSYLRAVMAADEKSERVLALTEHVITMNPAHYTVWLYRADTLRALKSDPKQELEWLNKISLKHLKNYQIWHHRNTIMSQIDTLPPKELSFLNRMLAKDAKNYHVWSYRQWLVAQFSLWSESPGSTELEFTESLLRADIRNNSAWNHRYYVVFGNPEQQQIPAEICEREIEFAKSKIYMAPQNQSAWNYLKGVIRKSEKGMEPLEKFAEGFTNDNGEVRSSHALDFLAEMWAQAGTEEKKAKAEKALSLLAEKYDPVRKNYWDYRKRLLGTRKA